MMSGVEFVKTKFIVVQVVVDWYGAGDGGGSCN